jgi:hypothetical protein
MGVNYVVHLHEELAVQVNYVVHLHEERAVQVLRLSYWTSTVKCFICFISWRIFTFPPFRNDAVQAHLHKSNNLITSILMTSSIIVNAGKPDERRGSELSGNRVVWRGLLLLTVYHH